MSGRWLFLVALLLVVGFAPAPFPRKNRSGAEDDLNKLQGEWIVIEHQRGGRKLPDKPGSMQLSIVKDRWTFSSDGRVASEWRGQLNPSSTPRAVDLKHLAGADVTILAIYRFDEGKLYFCYDAQGSRPTNFDASGGGWLMILKRR